MTRILSYNILHGGEERLPLIRDVIRAQAPDAVALLEASVRENAEWLARELGMALAYGEANSNYCVAWLSRLPITRIANHRRPVFRKTLLEIEVEHEGGPLCLFATHLASRHDGGEARVAEEMRVIVEILRERAGVPHLLVGDFNTLHPDDALDPERPLSSDVAGHTAREYAKPRLAILLAAGYIDCYRARHLAARGYTYRVDFPLARIDYTFASPELAPRLAACEVIRDALTERPSDHLPIWVDLT